jgi:hypothetical protein
MSKMYGGLFKDTSGKVLYRNIYILDMIPNKGFYVLVQDRLWTESSPTLCGNQSHQSCCFRLIKKRSWKLTKITQIV